jgi:hypothetical protein
MRKQDKNKNIEQANLVLEQSYLKSKGLLKEDMFGNTDSKYGNHGVGRADSPANTGGDEVTVKKEDTAKHPYGMEVNVYSNGIIEFCKDKKMVDAYKYSSPSARSGGFKAVKDYFEKAAEKDIDKFDIFNGSKMQYAGTLLKSRNLPSSCGAVSEFNDSSWVR